MQDKEVRSITCKIHTSRAVFVNYRGLEHSVQDTAELIQGTFCSGYSTDLHARYIL